MNSNNNNTCNLQAIVSVGSLSASLSTPSLKNGNVSLCDFRSNNNIKATVEAADACDGALPLNNVPLLEHKSFYNNNRLSCCSVMGSNDTSHNNSREIEGDGGVLHKNLRNCTNKYHSNINNNDATFASYSASPSSSVVLKDNASLQFNASSFSNSIISSNCNHNDNFPALNNNGRVSYDPLNINISSNNNGNNVDSDNCDVNDEDSSSSEPVRTLFVSGLPMDTKSRELYLLFRGYEGFCSATLKQSGKNGKPTAPVGFVTFQTRDQADLVMNTLQSVKFDPEINLPMRLEFARSNTKVTKQKTPNNLSLLNGVQAIGYPLNLSNVFAMSQQQQLTAPNNATFTTNNMPNPGGAFMQHLGGYNYLDDAQLLSLQELNNQQWGYDPTALLANLFQTPTYFQQSHPSTYRNLIGVSLANQQNPNLTTLTTPNGSLQSQPQIGNIFHVNGNLASAYDYTQNPLFIALQQHQPVNNNNNNIPGAILTNQNNSFCENVCDENLKNNVKFSLQSDQSNIISYNNCIKSIPHNQQHHVAPFYNNINSCVRKCNNVPYNINNHHHHPHQYHYNHNLQQRQQCAQQFSLY